MYATPIKIRTGKTFLSRELLRQIWSIMAQFSIEIQAKHICGADNGLADLLSRAHLSPTLQERLQCTINEHKPDLHKMEDVMFDFQ